MGIAFEENEAGSVVALEGTVDISLAFELKALLTKALAAGRHLSIQLDRASCLDVTAVQLLWSAVQQARRSGLELSLSGHLTEPISQLLADAGIPPFPDAASSDSVNVK